MSDLVESLTLYYHDQMNPRHDDLVTGEENFPEPGDGDGIVCVYPFKPTSYQYINSPSNFNTHLENYQLGNIVTVLIYM